MPALPTATPMHMTLRSATRPVLRPPYIPDDERRERYRRHVLHLPGPLDRWVRQFKMPEEQPKHRNKICLDFVVCSLEVECQHGESKDGFFVDPDVYTLWMVLDAPDDLDLPRDMRQSPRFILEQYTGDPDCLNAPDWTRWSLRRVRQATLRRGPTVYMAWSLITYMPNLRKPGLSAAMAEWCQKAADRTYEGELIKQAALQHFTKPWDMLASRGLLPKY